jgi:hypothetical protein
MMWRNSAMRSNGRVERRARRRLSLALYPSRVRSNDLLGGDGASTKLVPGSGTKVWLKKLSAADLRSVLEKTRLYRVPLSTTGLNHAIYQSAEFFSASLRALFKVAGYEWS